MSSGANRGAYFAGFPAPLLQAGIGFELLAGVSAGGIAAAWFAARQWDDLVRSWREACAWRVAPHPAFNVGRWRNVDGLIQRITLRIMDVERARTSSSEVRLGVARVRDWRTLRPPRVERGVLSSREARDAAHFALMLRATGFVPYMNGCRAAVEIDGERYLDGGLVTRLPLAAVPEGRYDELWIAACSPHSLAELGRLLRRWRRPERLVLITPSSRLPVTRWTMTWRRIAATIEIGRRDMAEAVQRALDGTGHVSVGRIADPDLRAIPSER